MLSTVTLAFLDDHPLETARILEQERPEQLAAFIAQVDSETAAKLLAPMTPATAAACLLSLDPEARVAIVTRLPVHSSGAALRTIGGSERDVLLAGLPQRLSDRLRRILSYSADSAGAYADSDALAVSEDITVGNVIARARRAPDSLRKYIYVLDDEHRLTGTVDARRCFLSPRATKIGALAEHHPISARAHASLAEVADLAAWEHLDVLPVIDRGNTYVGALRRHSLMQALESTGDRPERTDLAEIAADLADLYWDAAASIFYGSRQ